MSISKHVYQVGGAGFTSPGDAAIYLVIGNAGAALIDAGCGGMLDRLLKNIESCGVMPSDIRYLLLTHCHYDHTGGAAELRDRLPCQIVAHAADAVYLEAGDSEVTAASWYGARLEPFTVDHHIMTSPEDFIVGDLTITAWHMPGHSPGSVVYMMGDDGQKVCFGQDVHGPIDRRLLSNRADYRKSLLRLMEMEPDILCEGHFGVFHGKDKVKAFIGQYL